MPRFVEVIALNAARHFTLWTVLRMWIVAIAWMYVAIMMTLAEATSPQGTVLGALITFFLYGVGPIALVMYLLGAPGRRKALRAKEASERAEYLATQTRSQTQAGGVALQPDSAATKSEQADAGRLSPGHAIPPEGKEP